MAGLVGLYDRDNGAARSGATVALAGEYFISNRLAAALFVTAPRTHSFAVPGSPGTAAPRASARLQSSTLSLKYYFAPDARLRPYLGAGIDVTTLDDANAVAGLDRVAVGPEFAAGLDLSLSPHWLLNAAVGWAQIRPDTAAAPGREIHLDPVQFELGFRYRFGAQP